MKLTKTNKEIIEKFIAIYDIDHRVANYCNDEGCDILGKWATREQIKEFNKTPEKELADIYVELKK